MPEPCRRVGRPAAAILPALLALALTAIPARPGGAAPPDEAQLPPGQVGQPLAPVGARSPYGAVASDTEAASRAAAAILEAGGNAVDAAVAGALALGAAAPASSGLGGSTWIVVHTAAGEDVAFVPPLRAPIRVNAERAKSARRGDVMTGPLAPTAPATVAALAKAHSRFGTRPWAELVAPAIAVAEAGFRVNEVERLFLLLYRDEIEASPSLGPLYLTGACDDAGAVPVAVGHHVVLPGLARTLRRLAEAGPDDFYRGAIASEIVADLSRHGAFLRADDLARVPASIVEASPLRGKYRDLDVLTLPSPGSGGVVLETLHILQSFPSGLLGSQPWARAQALVEAVRISFADARTLTGETEVPAGPLQSPWLSPSWGKERAGLVRLGRAIPAERVPGARAGPVLSDRDTTHLAVVDREGNAVSLTQSLGRSWGSTYVTPGLGFPYNAFLEPYDLENPRSPVFLRPSAAIRTAVAPTILLREGRPVLVLGAAGSTRIPSVVANVVVGVVDEGLGVAAAVAAPRATWPEGSASPGPRLEVAAPVTPADVDLLRAIGYVDLQTFAPGPETSNFGGLNAVGWDSASGSWEAGAEPRRGGWAAVPRRALPFPPSREGSRP